MTASCRLPAATDSTGSPCLIEERDESVQEWRQQTESQGNSQDGAKRACQEQAVMFAHDAIDRSFPGRTGASRDQRLPLESLARNRALQNNQLPKPTGRWEEAAGGENEKTRPKRGMTLRRALRPRLRLPAPRCKPDEPARLLRCHRACPGRSRWRRFEPKAQGRPAYSDDGFSGSSACRSTGNIRWPPKN